MQVQTSAARFALVLAIGSLWATGCSDDASGPSWSVEVDEPSAALLSLWGTSDDDVWAVGADTRDGRGPLVLHRDGGEFQRVDTGLTEGNLWWVFGFQDGPIFMGGEGGLLLRYESGSFEVMDTPGTETVFGIWGSAPDDLWAVGAASASAGGFVWRYQGESWAPEATPEGLLTDAAVWKVFGTSADDVRLVGSNGVAMRWDGTALQTDATGVGSSLFTVHAAGGRYAAVGGYGTGIIVEDDGSGWTDVSPAQAPGLTGVYLDDGGRGLAVGEYGTVMERGSDGWSMVDLGFVLDQNLHSAWIDPSGGLWVAGGQTFSPPFTDGVVAHDPGGF